MVHIVFGSKSVGRDPPGGHHQFLGGSLTVTVRITNSVWFYSTLIYVTLGMGEWLIRKPLKREVAEMESQKGSTAGDVNNKRKIDENESANFQL
ncbi:hypothetical protein T07_875 [Trichinella nelsoni]|uniref:Uncharacterized protein n=1 Tax=Trichinella nelsoni TaxID=6336 RepID=A0A0V0SGU0_9BILA|nr:hypothetical protein T07_875 [Trichinella nelsoni]